MNNKILATLFLIGCLFASSFAQTSSLPKLKKGESYKGVRAKMIKAGWKPYHSPNADKCAEGDNRCEGKPEMEACAGTGLANCVFLWKRQSRTVAIFTIGENPGYSGFKFQ